MTESGTRRGERAKLMCLDVVSWRIPTKEELCAFMVADARSKRKRSVLAVRHHLSPVDVYCYLKARFGEPNGFQNFLRRDTSDNYIHWDYNLKAGDEDVYIYGMSREIHFVVSEKVTDENWRDLILGIKADYKRVASEKSGVFKSLAQWVTFPNRFVEIAAVCADMHTDIVDNIGGFQIWKSASGTKKKVREQHSILKRLTERASHVHRSCLQLSLLTPVLAEAFINMLILILCKPEIRENTRQFESFIRSQIDTKIFDLAYKCRGFVRPIDQHAETFKKFKRVMDKRNHSIHGNCDPVREQVKLVYFDGKRPLFKEAGDHIGKLLETLERQHAPDVVIRDYEDAYAFLEDIVRHVERGLVESARQILESSYPGYDIERKKMGCLFPNYVAVGTLQGTRYDDELNVWN
jgi:hypothetical protein